MIKGDRIKLKRKMGMFTNIGEVCEVTDISDDGTICFKCSLGFGCMSYNEYEKYFDPVIEEIPTPKVWSEWESYDVFFTDFNESKELVHCEWRTNNKSIQIRVKDNTNIKSKTSCYKEDEFNLATGFKIVLNRLYINWLKSRLKERIKDM